MILSVIISRSAQKALSALAASALALLVLASCATVQLTRTVKPGAQVGISLPSQSSDSWVLAGELLKNSLTSAGFMPQLQFASRTNAIHSQKLQLSAMIAAKTPVIVVAAIDPRSLGAQLEAAGEAGITIIALDQNLAPSSDNARTQASYFVGYNPYTVGQLQATALLAGLRADKGPGPYNIELFAGTADVASSRIQFDGAMSILTPQIDNKTLVVRSGATTFTTVATASGLPANVTARMKTLRTRYYQTAPLDGVLAPNDIMARAAIMGSPTPAPVTTGAEIETSTVEFLLANRNHTTIYTSQLVEARSATELIVNLSKGRTTTFAVDKISGVTAPFVSLKPVAVTSLNATSAFADNPELLAALNR